MRSSAVGSVKKDVGEIRRCAHELCFPKSAAAGFRHDRARPGHPRLTSNMAEDVDGRAKPGHDTKETLASSLDAR
jgi:hypothetical protein